MEFVGRDSFSGEIENYADFDLLVIDESHNFRNAKTNRWENIFQLLATGKPKKLVLLTATPVNNSVFDLYNQLRLITRDNGDFFASSGIKNLKGYFQKAEADKENLYDILEEIAVRRSRYFIKKNYPDAEIDGKTVQFPERELHTARYSLEKSYKGLYKEIASTIENLYLAPYNPEAYRKAMISPEFEGLKDRLLKEGWREKDAHDYMMNLSRGTALVQIMKILYLKRLESSIEALKISLVRQRDFQEKFLQLLEKNRLLDASTYRKFFIWNGVDEQEQENEIDIDEVIAQLPEVNPNLYDLNTLKKFVNEDVNALTSIIKKLRKIEAREDDKLRELKKILLGDLKGKKVVVFTYFKDTAR
jgi:superfamily II DNA or RNA helicase